MKTSANNSLNPVLLTALIWGASVSVSAHESSIEPLLRECASVDQDQQRLACYDQVLRPAEPVERPERAAVLETVAAEKIPQPQSAPVSVPEEQDQPVPGEKADPVVKQTPERNETPETPVPKITPTPESAPAAPTVAADKPQPGDRFGLKQKQPKETIARNVRVTGIRKDLRGHFVYTTEDGQIWRQIDTRRVRYDEVPFLAEIRSAALGSFYLKSKSSGVSVRVRREK